MPSGWSYRLQFELHNKIALVTGASGGLGSHFARILAQAGAHVILTTRRLSKLEALQAEIEATGSTATSIALDVTNCDSIEECITEVSDTIGTISVLVNNAGITSQSPAIDMDEDDWDRVQNTNLKGPMLLARACAARMIKTQKSGSIINISSILGFRVSGQLTPYIASKAALEHLSRALALEWARYNIRVNCIAPGYIETDMNTDFFQSLAGQAVIKRIPQRRLGQVCDLDGALLLLASDASSYMTGSTIVVDGGHLQSSL
jgi:NAD(P)-dependent dehydrogenase (short-subunit alcohol dehydrogenase family)